MAEMEPVVSPEMFARIKTAAFDLEHAMKKAHLTPRQIQEVSLAIQEYLQEMQKIVADSQATQTVQPSGEVKTGWTEEDMKPFLDAGAIRLK